MSEKESPPRILIIDDLFGRILPDRRNEDRSNLCGQYLLEDVTGDEAGKGAQQKVKRPIARAVFHRGQRPACSTVGDVVENDLEGTLRVVRDGWLVPDGEQCWALVLLDLCFYTGPVTEQSHRRTPGMPEGRSGDDTPDGYFGLRILQALQAEMPDLPVVILSSKPRDEVSRKFSYNGARAFIERERGTPELLEEYLRRHGLIPDPDQAIAGRSKMLLRALRDARQVAESKQPVLIRGEAGAGKELLARFIHDCGPRARKPFEAVSLPAIPSPLVEDTLFGHIRGAFDGANSDRPGKFETAAEGTLFLDEVGDTPPDVQPKLLRAIQDGEVQRLGTDRTTKVEVRIVSATNVDIEERVATASGFRRDLLDRLRAGGTVLLPPLRARKEDIPLLAEKFVREAEKETGALRRQLDAEAVALLRAHDWPGNIRELRNVLFDAVRQYPDVEHLVPVHLNLPGAAATVPAPAPPSPTATPPQPENIETLLRAVNAFRFQTREQLVGKLPLIERSFALLLARYLKAALEEKTENHTPENPRGEIRIQPTINMMLGSRVTTSKAADIIKQLLSVDREAVESMLCDPEEPLLREALERALSLRPTKRKPAADGGDHRPGSV